MKKVIYISYAVCAIAMFALLFYMFDHLRVIESNTREDNEYTQLQPYRTWVVKDSGAPIGVSKVFLSLRCRLLARVPRRWPFTPIIRMW